MTEVNNISFGARYECPARVKKRIPLLGLYLPSKASFVSIDFRNPNDVIAADEICSSWKGAPLLKKLLSDKKCKNIYALTVQRKNFENIEPDKILGFAKMKKYWTKDGELEYLQVNPNYINVGDEVVAKPKYKNCGSAILTSLKKFYDRIVLISVDDEKVGCFYERNDFVKIAGRYCAYIWERVKSPGEFFGEKYFGGMRERMLNFCQK